MSLIVLFAGTLCVSLLTFFSGFGLGTLLLPFLSLFFTVEVAVVYTAVVHLLNNAYKAFLLRRSIEWMIVLRFGVPALLGAAGGALLLSYLSHWNVEYPVTVFGVHVIWKPIKWVIGLLLLFVGLNELLRFLQLDLSGPQALMWGGFVSGFSGGLAGLQGAFRSYFLLKWAQDKAVFLGTSAAAALLVDLSRLFVYTAYIPPDWEVSHYGAAVLAASLVGIFTGKQLLPKLEMRWIHQFVAYLLVLFGFSFCLGLI